MKLKRRTRIYLAIYFEEKLYSIISDWSYFPSYKQCTVNNFFLSRHKNPNNVSINYVNFIWHLIFFFWVITIQACKKSRSITQIKINSICTIIWILVFISFFFLVIICCVFVDETLLRSLVRARLLIPIGIIVRRYKLKHSLDFVHVSHNPLDLFDLAIRYIDQFAIDVLCLLQISFVEVQNSIPSQQCIHRITQRHNFFSISLFTFSSLE